MTFPITTTQPDPLCRPAAGPRGCRGHRRRRHRGDDGVVPARQGPVGALVRKGSHRGRTIQPQLGLDPPAGPRPVGIADHDREPAPSGNAWPPRSAQGLGFRQTGVMYLAQDAKARSTGSRHGREHSRAHQLDTRLLTATEVGAMLKGAAGAVEGRALHRLGRAGRALGRGADAGRGGRGARRADRARPAPCAGWTWPAGRVAGVVTEAGPDRLRSCSGRGRRLVAAVPAPPRREDAAAFGAGLGRRDRADARDISRRCRRRRLRLPPPRRWRLFAGPRWIARMISSSAPMPLPVLRSPTCPILKNDIRAATFRLAAPKGFPDAWRTPRRWQ